MRIVTRTIHNESILVLSDIHLKLNSDQNYVLLKKVLKETEAEIIIFNGDIFDYIFASKKFFQDYWKDFFNLCKELRSHGKDVYFIEGNHDFGFEHFDLDHGFKDQGDFELRLDHPVLGLMIIRHGDDIVCPWHYHWFRRFVKSNLFQKIACLFPGSWMFYLFNLVAKASRSQDRYRKMTQAKVLQKIQNSGILKQTIQTLVLGHVHLWLDQLLNETRVLIGPSWDDLPNGLLLEKDGTISRIRY